MESLGGNAWFFPCGDERAVRDFLLAGMERPDFSLHYLRPCDAEWLAQQFPGRWELRRDDASDEYICTIAEYLAMEGGKFAEARKKIRHIEREHSVEVKQISEGNVQDAFDILSQWRTTAHHVGRNNIADENVSETALQQREELGISGILLYLDGQPTAMFAGFPINSEVVDVVLGKCVPNAPDYTVYLAMREYLKSCQNQYQYSNMEEDLGIPGIRMVKMKMRPSGKNEIWEAALR